MKRLILSLVTSSMLFVGCDDFLDKGPKNLYSEDVVWEDATLGQSFIYTTMREIGLEYFHAPKEQDAKKAYSGSSDCHTDNTVTLRNNGITRNIITSNDDVNWDMFDLIRRTNVIIKNSEESSSLNEGVKNSFVGQGKFLRALIYYKQARMFGGYVIVEKPLEVGDNLNIPRSTVDETYDFIIKDLQDAAELLDANVSNSNIGKGAALALLSEVALQAAAYTEEGTAKIDSYYTIAKKACEDLFALGKYSLHSSYYDIFNDFDNGANNSEIIYGQFLGAEDAQAKCSELPVYKHYPSINPTAYDPNNLPYGYEEMTGSMGGNGAKWGYQPSQDIVNEYLVKDVGYDWAPGTGKWVKWNETVRYQKYVEGYDQWGTPGTPVNIREGVNTGVYASAVLSQNRDQRFYDSIVSDSTKMSTAILYMRQKGNAHVNMSKKGDLNNFTGFFTRKSVEDRNIPLGENVFQYQINYHTVIFRLGRVYLNYAEALLRLGGNDDIARQYINYTRETHGKMDGLDASVVGDDLLTAYKSERRVELFWEYDRYWSLLRWAKAEGKTWIPELQHSTDPAVGKDLTRIIEVQEGGMGFKDIELGTNSRNTWNGTTNSSEYYLSTIQRVWDEKKFLLPVPQAEIVESGNVLTQNIGW